MFQFYISTAIKRSAAKSPQEYDLSAHGPPVLPPTSNAFDIGHVLSLRGHSEADAWHKQIDIIHNHKKISKDLRFMRWFMEHQWGTNMHQWDTTGGCIQQYGLRFRPKMVRLMINLPLTCRHGALTLDAPMFSVYMKMLLQLMHRSKLATRTVAWCEPH